MALTRIVLFIPEATGTRSTRALLTSHTSRVTSLIATGAEQRALLTDQSTFTRQYTGHARNS